MSKPLTQASLNQQDTQTIDENDVINYLRMQPNFFADKPGLLKLQKLNIPGNKQAISLQERQIELLRKQLDELETHIQELSGAARDNEKLLNRWHQLTLDLLEPADLGTFFGLLEQRLRHDYAAEYVVMRVSRQLYQTAALSDINMFQQCVPASQSVFETLLCQPEAWCGRLTLDKNNALFGDQGVASAVVVGIAPHGVLAIGSDDPDRYAPGTGVLFIELLAKTIRWQLERHRQTETDKGSVGNGSA